MTNRTTVPPLQRASVIATLLALFACASCAPSCPTTGHAECAGACVDTTTALNCGGCNVRCPSGPHAFAVCTNQQCTTQCEPGFTRCGDACVDVAIDSANCGGCGVHCGSEPNATVT